jgi:hypothetical protein
VVVESIVWESVWVDQRDGRRIGIFATRADAKRSCEEYLNKRLHSSDKVEWNDKEALSYGKSEYHNFEIISVEVGKIDFR